MSRRRRERLRRPRGDLHTYEKVDTKAIGCYGAVLALVCRLRSAEMSIFRMESILNLWS